MSALNRCARVLALVLLLLLAAAAGVHAQTAASSENVAGAGSRSQAAIEASARRMVEDRARRAQRLLQTQQAHLKRVARVPTATPISAPMQTALPVGITPNSSDPSINPKALDPVSLGRTLLEPPVMQARNMPRAQRLSSSPVSSSPVSSSPVGGSPWAIVVGLTLLTLLPALLLAVTPMVRLLVVFHFLRQALGTQTAPSNQILMGLALMMTWFLVAPVLTQVEATATTPYRQGAISGEVAFERGIVPVKSYMLRYAREKDLAVFVAAGMPTRPRSKEDLPIQVVVPAYILSELKAGFQIGAVLFLPFLLVDLVVASVTTSIGMLQLPPVVISTPVKILLFVMVDGWNLLADKLLKSF